jgi:tetratricopeptide (TPR) repeat protein
MSVGRHEMELAVPLLDEAIALYRELDDKAGIAKSLWAIGNLYQFMERYEQAIAPLDEAISLFHSLGDGFGRGWAMHTRAIVAIALNDAATAEPLVCEALEMFSNAGDVSGITILVDDAAHVARLRGERLRSLRLAGASTVLQAKTGTDLANLANVAGGRPAPTPDDDEEMRVWTEGGAMTTEAVVSYALARESVA